MVERNSPEKVSQIVGQYRQVVGAMENMFQAANPRTNNQPWRRNGVGSCEQPDKKLSENGLFGHARNELIALREKRNEEHGGVSTITPCPYHREGVGCVLGDLKSPLCITWVDNAYEWQERFDVDLVDISKKAKPVLEWVLAGGARVDPKPIQEFIQNVEEETKKVERKPRLEGGSLRERIEVFIGEVRAVPKKLYNSWLWRHA